MKTLACTSCLFVAIAAPAFGQCAEQVQISLLDAFRATGNPTPSQMQSLMDAWLYKRGSPDGDLMEYLFPGGWLASAWGSPARPFGIPAIGPVVSPDANQNQNPFFDRAPSFTGLFVHPGNTASEDAVVVFAPHTAVTVHAATLRAEVIGNLSNGVTLSCLHDAAGGATVIAPTFVGYTTAGSTSLQGSNLPVMLQHGQRLWMRVNMNGSPTEDWGNFNLTLTISGGPVIVAGPTDKTFCVGVPTSLRVVAAGSGPLSYQWRREDPPGSGTFIPLVDGPGPAPGSSFEGAQSPELRILNPGTANASRYSCTITGCVPVTTFANLGVCPVDLNCDGATDFNDYLEFLNLYNANDPRVDFNQDGAIDFNDYLEFLNLYNAGC